MKTLYKAIIISLIVWGIGFIIHMPVSLQKSLFQTILLKPIYTDSIAYLKTSITAFKNGLDYLTSYPYIGYSFPFPPVIGFIWLILTRTTYLFLSMGNLQLTLDNICDLFYILYSLLGLFLLIMCFHFLSKLSDLKIVFFMLPSLILYIIYGWSILWLILLVLFIYYIEKDRGFLAGVMLGLMIAVNPYAAALIPLTIYSFYYLNKTKLKNIMIGAAIPLASYALLFLSSNSATMFWNRYFPSSCMNCSLLVLTSKISIDYILPLSYIIVMTITFLVLGLDAKPVGLKKISIKVLLVIAASILFSVSYLPQYGLIVALGLLLLAKELRVKLFILLSDILNALIIILWFHDLYLRKALSFLNLGLTFNPWSLNSPVQWVVQARNIIQIIVFLVIASGTLCLKPEEKL